MIAFDSNAKSIIYVRCLNGFLSKNRLKEVSCLRIQKKKKKCLRSSVFKSPGDAAGLRNGVCANGDELEPFITLAKQRANHCHGWSFHLFL